MTRIDEVKTRVRQLQTMTLHGNIPLKTIMQLVNDIVYLLSLVNAHLMDKHGPFCVKCGKPRSQWRIGDECQLFERITKTDASELHGKEEGPLSDG